MIRIISFSGRKSSGKSLLCNICNKYGYININFSDELKNLCCSLLNISFDDLNNNKEIPNKFILNQNQIKLIEKETNISYEILNEKIENFEFSSIRHLLQYLGTDIIRENNKMWHISRIKKKILDNPKTKFVLSDARFKNEFNMIKEIGGICWMIIRPNYTKNISNHISETSLQWKDFPLTNLIINDLSLEDLIFNWKMYMSYNINQFYKENLKVFNDFQDGVEDNLLQLEDNKLLL